MTTIESINAVRNLLKEPLSACRTFPDDSSGFWADSVLLSYMNMVQQDVQQEIVSVYEDHFVTQTTVSIANGTTRYALPTDFLKMRKVEDIQTPTDPVPIEPTSLNQVSEYASINVSSNHSLGGYYLLGNSLYFENTPTFTAASAIRLHYIKRLANLSAASDVSEIPAEWHRALVWGTYNYCQTQQEADTSRSELMYEKILKKIMIQAENRQVNRPRKVVRRKNGSR